MELHQSYCSRLVAVAAAVTDAGWPVRGFPLGECALLTDALLTNKCTSKIARPPTATAIDNLYFPDANPLPE